MIYCLVGPSGSGKNTLGEEVFERLGIGRLITHTTRPMRLGERNGVSYYFTNVEEFNNINKVEQANYAGNYYGLSCVEVENKLKKDEDVYVILEQSGAKKLKSLYGDSVLVIFIKISEENMIKRIKDRGDQESDILTRIKNAKETDEFNFDAYDFMVENESFEIAKSALLDIIEKTSK